MLVYQITVNGKHVATAGVQQGGLFAAANLVYFPPDGSTVSPSKPHAWFALLGSNALTSEQLEWFSCDVRVGDEISIKLIETDQADEPMHRRLRPEVAPRPDHAGWMSTAFLRTPPAQTEAAPPPCTAET